MVVGDCVGVGEDLTFVVVHLLLLHRLQLLLQFLVGHTWCIPNPAKHAAINKDILHQDRALTVKELCESRGGRPGLSVLTSLMVSVDVKQY